MKFGLVITTLVTANLFVLTSLAAAEWNNQQTDQDLTKAAKRHIPGDLKIAGQSVWPASGQEKSKRAVVAAGPYLYLFIRDVSGNWEAAGKFRPIKSRPGSNPTPKWVEFASDGKCGFVYSSNENGCQFSGFTISNEGIKGGIPEMSQKVLDDLKSRVGKRLQQEKPAPLDSFPNAKDDLDGFLDAVFKYLNVGLQAKFR